MYAVSSLILLTVSASSTAPSPSSALSLFVIRICEFVARHATLIPVQLIRSVPITPITIDKESRHITLAYFDQKSTVDYIGVVQGIPVCFDAKECAGERFALQNIHEHQMEYMQDFERQDGIAFLIVYFKEAGAYYYVPFRDVKRFWDRAAEGGRKSFLRHELDQDYQIRTSNQIFIHYLDALSRDLESRPES